MIRLFAIAFASGAWWLQQQAHLWPAWFWIPPLGVAAAAVWRIRHPVMRAGVLIACIAAMGFAWANMRAQTRLADELAPAWENREVTLVGVVHGVPFRVAGLNASGVRFGFETEQVGTDAANVPKHVSLTWYARGDDADLPALAPGQRWQLQVKLRRPHGAANPFGFDFEQWLLEQNIRATGTVRPAQQINARLDEFVASPSTIVDRARDRIARHIRYALADASYAGVMVALVVGEQSGISTDDWVVFNRTGIGHLLSISGLHITMLATFAALLARTLWRVFARRGMRWTLRISAQQAAALTGFATALVYTLLAGFAVPAQRTLWMLGVVATALFMQRGFRYSYVLALALLLVVALDPWSVVAPGFWLSFVAVAILMFTGGESSHPRRNATAVARHTGALRSAARAQAAVTIGLAPLTVLFFQQASLAGPLANAIAIPVVSFVVTPLALLGGLLGAVTGIEWPLHLAHSVFDWLACFLGWLSHWPWASLEWAAPAHWTIIAAAAGLGWLFAPRGVPARGAGALLLAPLLLTEHPMPLEGTLKATALDVGQGTAVLVETAHHRLLYDTGPRYSEDADAGNRVVVPYLRAIGARRLDGLVVSHADQDHSGGAESVLAEREVGWLLSPLEPGSPIVAAADRSIRCLRGLRWAWDGVSFEVLHPGEVLAARSNASSCVLRVAVGAHAILLTGDIERAQEAVLAAERPDAARADVLLVPHHGSLTSSSDVFIEAVAPTLAVVQAGYLNRFGHPRTDVLNRYAAAGATLVRTDLDGAITIELSADGLHWEAWRDAAPRYWHAPR